MIAANFTVFSTSFYNFLIISQELSQTEKNIFLLFVLFTQSSLFFIGNIVKFKNLYYPSGW